MKKYLRFLDAFRGCGKTTKLIDSMIPFLEKGENINIVIISKCEEINFKSNKRLVPYLSQIEFVYYNTLVEEIPPSVLDPRHTDSKFNYNYFISHEVYEMIIFELIKILENAQKRVLNKCKEMEGVFNEDKKWLCK